MSPPWKSPEKKGSVTVSAEVAKCYGLVGMQSGTMTHVKKGDGSPYPIVIKLDDGPIVQCKREDLV